MSLCGNGKRQDGLIIYYYYYHYIGWLDDSHSSWSRSLHFMCISWIKSLPNFSPVSLTSRCCCYRHDNQAPSWRNPSSDVSVLEIFNAWVLSWVQVSKSSPDEYLPWCPVWSTVKCPRTMYIHTRSYWNVSLKHLRDRFCALYLSCTFVSGRVYLLVVPFASELVGL